MTPETIVAAVEHVSLAVRDVDAAKATYKALGFREAWTEELDEQGIRSHVLRSGQVLLELLEHTAEGRESDALQRYIAQRGEGVHHVCLRVDDLASAIAAVKAAGLRLVSDEPTVDEEGRRVFVHPSTTHGVLLGLVEPHHKPSDPISREAGRREVIDTGLPEFAGKTFVPAVKHPGIPLFVSGLNAVEESGRVEAHDVVGQARVIFRKLGDILQAAGATPSNVVKTTDYIIERKGYKAVADVRREFFGADFPAATGIVVKELFGGPGVLLEMDAVAVL